MNPNTMKVILESMKQKESWKPKELSASGSLKTSNKVKTAKEAASSDSIINDSTPKESSTKVGSKEGAGKPNKAKANSLTKSSSGKLKLTEAEILALEKKFRLQLAQLVLQKLVVKIDGKEVEPRPVEAAPSSRHHVNATVVFAVKT